MRSPLSPVIANLFMEDFKTKALSSSPNPPRIWLRFVKDTFVVDKAEHTQQFLTHLNSLDPNIQFTTESPDQQGCLPFLDTLTSQGPDGTLITMVYGKPTHTDQYLHWDSHHIITTNTAFITLSHTGCSMSVQTNIYYNRKSNISKQLSADVIILIECSTDSKPNWNSNLVQNNGTTTRTHVGTATETTTSS